MGFMVGMKEKMSIPYLKWVRAPTLSNGVYLVFLVNQKNQRNKRNQVI
jgi:hypothetical protein